MQKATLLLAHGSRDPNWLAPFDRLLETIEQGLTAQANRVELAYMELAVPSLENQVRKLAGEGIAHIDILPLFFAAGRHLRNDVPNMLAELEDELASKGHKAILRLHTPVGLEPEVAKAISQVVIRHLHDN